MRSRFGTGRRIYLNQVRDARGSILDIRECAGFSAPTVQLYVHVDRSDGHSLHVTRPLARRVIRALQRFLQETEGLKR